MVKKGVFRSSRKWMNPMPEEFAFEVVSPVYLVTTPLVSLSRRHTDSRSRALVAKDTAQARSEARRSDEFYPQKPVNRPGVHFVWTGDEQVIVQIQASGPWDIHYINPVDDPRNKK